MLAVGKAVLVLMLDIVFSGLLGTLINNRIWKRAVNPAENMVMGFFAQQAIFQILALFVYWKTAVLHHLSVLWAVTAVLLVLIAIFWAGEQIKKEIEALCFFFRANRGIVLAGAAVLLLFCYYVSINGQSDEDAMYYIGLVNTTVSTDRIYQYNVYNGEPMSSIYGRRALVTFEIQSAVLAQIFDLHALLVTRIFRACENVLLTGMSVYLCAEQLYEKQEKKCQKAIQLMIVYFFAALMFADTIYTPAKFLLTRGYEGKAFTGNVIVLFLFHQIIKALRSKNRKACLAVLLVCWGSIAVSASAMLVTAAEVIVFLGFPFVGMWIVNKRERQKA